jgi:hypothetical protein
MVIVYQTEQRISKERYEKDYSSDKLYEKKNEQLDERLQILLESEKIMKVSKFKVCHN